MRNMWLIGGSLSLVWVGGAMAQQVFSATGANASDIQATMDSFRTALGTLNGNVPGSFGAGRREINWDAVPDAFSAPNQFPGNFFNQNFSPRARGAVFSTPGLGFAVSAAAGNPSGAAKDFGDVDPAYVTNFEAFSPQRLFRAIDSTQTDVTFFIPGSTQAATVSGFGVVFSDVDLENTTSLQLFDSGGTLLRTEFARATRGEGTFSFLGVKFDGAPVARVRITSGNAALAPGFHEDPGAASPTDLVVMDDFVYGEPVPGPGAGALALCGLGVALRRRR